MDASKTKNKLKLGLFAFTAFFILSIILEFLIFRTLGYTEILRLFILAILCAIIIISLKQEKLS